MYVKFIDSLCNTTGKSEKSGWRLMAKLGSNMPKTSSQVAGWPTESLMHNMVFHPLTENNNKSQQKSGICGYPAS